MTRTRQSRRWRRATAFPLARNSSYFTTDLQYVARRRPRWVGPILVYRSDGSDRPEVWVQLTRCWTWRSAALAVTAERARTTEPERRPPTVDLRDRPRPATDDRPVDPNAGRR